MIFNKFTYPRVLTDVYIEEIVEVVVRVFVINAWADAVIDALPRIYVDSIIDNIGVEVSTDVDTNVLVAAMTAL